jgi:hypothetical protein
VDNGRCPSVKLEVVGKVWSNRMCPGVKLGVLGGEIGWVMGGAEL